MQRLPIAISLGILALTWNVYGQIVADRQGTCLGRVDYFFAPLVFGSCFALAETELKNCRVGDLRYRSQSR